MRFKNFLPSLLLLSLVQCQPSYALDRVAIKYIDYTPSEIPYIMSPKQVREFYHYLKYDRNMRTILLEAGVIGVGNTVPSYYGTSRKSYTCFESTTFCRSTDEDYFNEYFDNIFLVQKNGRYVNIIVGDKPSSRKWYLGYTLNTLYEHPTNTRHTLEYIDMYGNRRITTIEYENRYGDRSKK